MAVGDKNGILFLMLHVHLSPIPLDNVSLEFITTLSGYGDLTTKHLTLRSKCFKLHLSHVTNK